jgi:hypothetical protein
MIHPILLLFLKVKECNLEPDSPESQAVRKSFSIVAKENTHARNTSTAISKIPKPSRALRRAPESSESLEGWEEIGPSRSKLELLVQGLPSRLLRSAQECMMRFYFKKKGILSVLNLQPLNVM